MPNDVGQADAQAARGPSPPTERVVAILDYLANDPNRPLTVSELAKQLRISQPTCHAIVTVLADTGYLLRAPGTKRYGLGPKLLSVGRATESALSAGHLVRSGLEELSALTGAVCSLRMLNEDAIVVVDIIGGSGQGNIDSIGTSYPFAPPFGFSFVVWGPDERAKSWVERAPITIPAEQRTKLARLTASCRRRGYIVYPPGGLTRELHRALLRNEERHIAENEAIQRLRNEVLQNAWTVGMLLEDCGDAPVDVSAIGAPIFGSDGTPRFAAELHLDRRGLSVGDVEHFGEQLRQITREATAGSGGIDPFLSGAGD